MSSKNKLFLAKVRSYIQEEKLNKNSSRILIPLRFWKGKMQNQSARVQSRSLREEKKNNKINSHSKLKPHEKTNTKIGI